MTCSSAVRVIESVRLYRGDAARPRQLAPSTRRTELGRCAMSTSMIPRYPELSGRVALVTGASRGLGQGFARGLTRFGSSVAMLARSEDALARAASDIRAEGGRVLVVTGDVTDAAAVQRVVRHVRDELGPIDLLVNNAGVMAPIGLDWEVDPAAWWRTMEVNVLGSYLCARAVLPEMLERRSGRIINVTSTAANKRYPVYSAYGASKAAMSHLTGSMDEATRDFGVHVFALSPGFVRTQMTEALADAPGVRQRLGDGFRKALDEGRHTPLAAAVEALLFLASGAGDALAGRQVDARDDLEQLVRLTKEAKLD
jgi:NAD(P)-dependent dehydrogenase (short-subunit alcohol dehydrogenase family)